MSGPVLRSYSGLNQLTDMGTYDGITLTVRPDIAGQRVIAPPLIYGATAFGTIEPWMREFTHSIGDFQFGGYYFFGDDLDPIATFNCLVIQFSKPVKRVRIKQHYGAVTGMRMSAVASAADINPDGTVNNPLAEVLWGPHENGGKVLTSEETPFSFLVLRSVGNEDHTSYAVYGPTFYDFYFYETLPSLAMVESLPNLVLPRGAGRLLSFTWPRFSSPGETNPQNFVQRPMAMSGASHMVQSVVGSPPAGIGQITYRGRRCLRVPAGNGTGFIHSPQGGITRPYQIFIGTERMLKANFDERDELGAYRVKAGLAFEQPGGPISRSCGIFIAPGNNTQVRGPAAQAGLVFTLADVDTFKVATRQTTGGALVEHDIRLPDGFDIEDWHEYEWRLIGATSTSEAVARLLIDDAIFLELPWGVGTELPPPIEGTVLGYYWGIINLGGSADFTTRMYVASEGVEFAASMTEDGLL